MLISELIKNRTEFVNAQKKNGFDLTTVLVGLYSDASHFVYEILQNAEDVKATEIIFELQEDKLTITHNGKPFTESDIEAITGISNWENDKKQDAGKIGKFGIGFKSVYAVTNSPRIQSGKFDFEITNFVLPNNFSDDNNFSRTIFTLNFDHPRLSSAAIVELITAKFETLEVFNLLFLSSLCSIRLFWPNRKRRFVKKSSTVKGSAIANDVVISVGREKYRYLLFTTPVQHQSFARLKVLPRTAIAFKKTVVDGVEELQKADSSNLFAYFETSYETFLNFLVQAPFSTTPARDSIDFKSTVNLALLDELCQLMRKAMAYFKEYKLISINLLNQLPVNSKIEDSKIVYKKFFHTVRSEFVAGKKYLPSVTKNQYQSAQDLAIVRGRELTTLLSRVEDLQTLFGKKYWMDTKITVDRNPDLYSYLTKELGIGEFAPEDFARKVTASFLQTKTDTWIQRLYEFLNGKQESLWRVGKGRDEGLLRKKPIIRLSSGEQVSPFDEDGKPKVFLHRPEQGISYDTVSPNVIRSKNALQFIKTKLGISEPDIFDEIKYHILPLYTTGDIEVTDNDHLTHIKMILVFYEKAGPGVRDELARLFHDLDIEFIRSFNPVTGELSYRNYRYTYLPSAQLRQYFRFSGDAWFVNEADYQTQDKELFFSFLAACGVRDFAWRTIVDPGFSENQLVSFRKEGNSGETRRSNWGGESLTDYQLEGLVEILEHSPVSREDSLLIWNILLHYLKKDPRSRSIFKGEYKWMYYSEHRISFDSTLQKTLQNANWLFQDGGDSGPRKPGELLVTELDREYPTGSDEALTLIEKLKFRSVAEQDLIDQMPPDRKQLFLDFEKAKKLFDDMGVDFDAALRKLTETANNGNEERELAEAPELNDIEIEEEIFYGFDDAHVQAGHIVSSSGNNGNENDGNDGLTGKPDPMSQKMREKLGERGEDIVFKYLKDTWSAKAVLISETENTLHFKAADGHVYRIATLNTRDRKGIGCDITISDDEGYCAYIEVKTTKFLNKELYPVNGFQWALARKLHRGGEGHKFFLYVVKDVLGDKPKLTIIQDPVQKWKDGALRAHPVNLEI